MVFNYSSLDLTEAQDRLFNHGFNFSILPKTLDISQLLADYKRLERPVIWKEFWHGQEDEEEEERLDPIFKVEKQICQKVTPPQKT